MNDFSLNRRRAMAFAAMGLAANLLPAPAFAAVGNLPPIKAYRNPGCGCCEKWAERLRNAGFTVSMEDDPDLAALKSKAGVPETFSGCHTAFMEPYILEGHVPLADVKRLLAEQPAIKGLAVPGMPAESEGMDTPETEETYDVIAFAADGSSFKFASH